MSSFVVDAGHETDYAHRATLGLSQKDNLHTHRATMGISQTDNLNTHRATMGSVNNMTDTLAGEWPFLLRTLTW
jgi:hypothetical protein